jgi:hypothetical protein
MAFLNNPPRIRNNALPGEVAGFTQTVEAAEARGCESASCRGFHHEKPRPLDTSLDAGCALR